MSPTSPHFLSWSSIWSSQVGFGMVICCIFIFALIVIGGTSPKGSNIPASLLRSPLLVYFTVSFSPIRNVKISSSIVHINPRSSSSFPGISVSLVVSSFVLPPLLRGAVETAVEGDLAPSRGWFSPRNLILDSFSILLFVLSHCTLANLPALLLSPRFEVEVPLALPYIYRSSRLANLDPLLPRRG